MAKIIVVGKQMDMGGTEVAMLALLNRLVEEGHDVTLLLKDKKGPLMNRIPKEVRVTEMDEGRSKVTGILAGKKYDHVSPVTTLVAKGIRLFLRKTPKKNTLYPFILKRMPNFPERFDVMLDFFGYGSFVTAYGAEKIDADRKATWFHVEDVNMYWGTVESGRINDYLKRYQKFYCVSDAVKQAFVKNFPKFAERAEVLLNFIDTESIVKKSDQVIPENEFTGDFKILSVGRLVEQKGYDVAIQSAKILKERGVKFQWYVIGDGQLQGKLEQLIRDLSLEDCFHLLGRKDNPFPYVRLCDLFVQSSRSEGYSVSIIEAKTLNRPIIVSDIPSNREQIREGVNGLFTSLDPGELAEKIEFLYRNPEKRMELSDCLKKESIDFSAEYAKLESFLGTIDK